MNATPFNVNDVEPQVYVYVGLVLITILFLFCLLVIICCKLLQACKRRATDEQHLIQPDSSKRTSTAVLLLPNAPIVQWSGFRTPQPSSVSSGTTGIGPTIHLPTNSENVLNAQPINGKRLNNLFQREYLKAKWPVLGPLSRSPKTHGQSGSNSLSADLIVGRGRDQITRKCLSLHHGRNRNGGSGVSLINSPIVSSMLSSTPLVEFTLHFVSRTNRLLVQINCVRHLQSIVTTNPSDARQMPSIQFKLMLQDSDGRTRGRLFKTNAEPASGGIVIYSEQRAQFPINVPFDRLQQMTLKMIVYLRRVLVSRKQTLGNLLIRLDRPDFESDQVLLLELKLMPVCPLTGRLLQPLVPVGDLGYLKIGLRLARAKPHSKESFQLHLLLQQARALATERKQKSTTNLTESPSDSAEFFVMINLLHGQETLDCQESKRSSGRHPNWNQSFVFHVDLDRLTLSDSNNNLDCESVSAKVENLQYLSDVLIELIVMRANRNRIEATVGCVRIGQKSVLAAKQHWLEACVTHQDDYVFRWHELQPLDRL